MSVRGLGEIFPKEDQPIGADIRERRLERVAADLREARFARQSIGEIAFRYGFSNMQNFLTLFRTHFERSPRDFRRSR
nr:helix-turn-helix domain-containing protein [Actibacterium sp. 188UL27-1]